MKQLSTNYRATAIASYIGYITQAIVNNFAPLLFLTFTAIYGIPTEQITFLITFNFGTQLLVDLLSPYVIRLFDYRVSVVLAHFSAALGMFGLAFFPAILPSPYAGLLLAVFFYAVGGGLIEVLVSPIIEACPFEQKAAAMSLLHSFYCWGQLAVVLFSTLFFVSIGIEHWQWLACLWGLIPLGNAFFFLVVPLALSRDASPGMSRRQLFSKRLFWLFLLMMLCAGAAELAMSQWASAFAEAGLGVTKTLGDLAGPCCFALLMGMARVIYSKIDGKVGLYLFMLGSALLCIVSYLMAALAPHPVIGLIGCALCGFSVGIMWPGTVSCAAKVFPQGGPVLFSSLALAGDLGCSFGPTLVGLLSASAGGGISGGLIAAVIFPVFLTAVLLSARSLRNI